MVDNPGAESSLISVAHTGPARSAPDFEALSVANTVLGGHFISRLNTNLREEKGWSYGMKSALGEATYLSMIEAGGSVQTDKTADALGEVARELRELASNRPPTSSEIQAAKNAMLLSFPATVEGPGGAFSLYRRTYEDRLPEDYWNSYVQKVQSLTPEEIKQASARLFRPSELTWFVVGDLSKIEADVRKLKLGDVQIFDEDGKRVR
jgi:zinc protease